MQLVRLTPWVAIGAVASGFGADTVGGGAAGSKQEISAGTHQPMSDVLGVTGDPGLVQQVSCKRRFGLVPQRTSATAQTIVGLACVLFLHQSSCFSEGSSASRIWGKMILGDGCAARTEGGSVSSL